MGRTYPVPYSNSYLTLRNVTIAGPGPGPDHAHAQLDGAYVDGFGAEDKGVLVNDGETAARPADPTHDGDPRRLRLHGLVHHAQR